MKRRPSSLTGLVLILSGVLLLTGAGFVVLQENVCDPGTLTGFDQAICRNASNSLRQGRQTFRYDTFGDEVFWGDTLHLHDAIRGEALGGVGPGVSPNTALAVGLKVDVDALPQGVKDALRAGEVDLDDPATTLTLLKLDAVVGLKGFFGADDSLSSVGITCALCHSTVDDSFAPGIG